jgi:hypothetical protein
VAGLVALFPQLASAHALIGRQDLPLPQWLFIYGSLVILIVSFVGLLLGWREPRIEGRTGRPTGDRISRLLVNRGTEAFAGALGVGLLVLVVWTGLTGVHAPDRNFSITFVFVTFWIGLVVASVLLGDVWRALNPWRAIARAFSALFTRVAGQSAPAPFAYPERLGRWPAVAGLAAFLFLELIWGQTGFAAAGLEPRDLAIATLVYSGYTFAAMALFGIERWTERGETFSVYFGMFARIAPLEVREGRLMRRPWLVGLTTWSGPAGSLAMVLIAISGTTFDGAQEGKLKEPINSLYGSLSDAGVSPLGALRISNLAYFLATLAVISLIFWAGIWGMRIVERKRSAGELGRLFAHAFVPIALAYVVAHYFSYAVYLEQAQFSFLLSDPFGTGADLFGTADSGIDYGVLSANSIWYVQVGAIVAGHVVALALGHERALKIWGNTRDAAWSQIWMLVMMMFFSVLGLILLSQSNG